MHRARTIAAISKAAEHLPLVEIALVLMHFDHVAPELDGSLRRGRLTSSPPQFGQAKYICSAQFPQYVHS